jgi:hypothetical protein
MVILLSQSRLFWVAPDGWVVYREKKVTISILYPVRLSTLLVCYSYNKCECVARLTMRRLGRDSIGTAHLAAIGHIRINGVRGNAREKLTKGLNKHIIEKKEK